MQSSRVSTTEPAGSQVWPASQPPAAPARLAGLSRFTLASVLYVMVCLLAGLVIVIKGDGPHPRVTGIYPQNGDRYFPGGAVEITFSQPMDQASVERGLQVSPGSEGQGAWYGNTLNLQPVGDWKPNVTYHVSLVGKVSDDQGRPLHTPVAFWFRVHHVSRLTVCTVHGVRNVCERSNLHRPLIPSAVPILSYALSPDGSLLAYTRSDQSGLPHLFVVSTDGTGNLQLTRGRTYADSEPSWTIGDSSDITYLRRPVHREGTVLRLGRPETWNITIEGDGNAPL